MITFIHVFIVGVFHLKFPQRVSFPLFFRSEGTSSADAKVAAQVASEESELCSTSVSSHVLLGDLFTSLLFCLPHSFNDFVISSLLPFGLKCCHLDFRVGLCMLEEMRFQVWGNRAILSQSLQGGILVEQGIIESSDV